MAVLYCQLENDRRGVYSLLRFFTTILNKNWKRILLIDYEERLSIIDILGKLKTRDRNSIYASCGNVLMKNKSVDYLPGIVTTLVWVR